jgi:hypothetical protein
MDYRTITGMVRFPRLLELLTAYAGWFMSPLIASLTHPTNAR